MNIMKTNMLLLDNKIKQDDAENTNTIAAPIPTATDSKSGMKALMFQGMQNLMANPTLAKEAGVMNDDTANEDAAKSYVAPYSSNVAFKGGNFAGKFRKLAVISAMALAAAGTLTSCKDVKDETNISIEVNVDQSAMMGLIAGLQSQFTQALLNQQISIDQFNKYMEQTEAWRKQVDQRMANFELILTSMADKIFDVDNKLGKNNAYQEMIIGMLEQFMTKDEAIALFNKIYAEVAANDKTTAQALAEIMKELKLVNQNLGTIIANQDRAYEQKKQELAVLGKIEGNTAETREAVKAADDRLANIHNTMIENNNQVVNSIAQLDGDMNAGFAYTAQTIGWSTQELGKYINMGVMTIAANNDWNAAKVISAIHYQTQCIKEGNEERAKFRADFNAGLLTAEQYAQKILEVENNIDKKVGILVEDFNSYAENMQKAATIAIGELKVGNKTSAETKELVKDVISNQQKAYAMYEIMNQNIDKIDVDVNAGIDALAKQLGCSTAQIVGTLKWLGYSQAQINSWIAANNTAAIVNAIKGSSNKIIVTLGDQLNTIIENMSNDPNTNNSFYIQQAVSLLEQIAGDVSEIKSSVAELNAKFDALGNKINDLSKWAKGIYFENKYQSGTVTYIAGALTGMAQNINDIKTTEEAILEKMDNGESLTAEEMEIIIARLGNGIHQDLNGVKALLRTDIAQNGVLINLVAKAVKQLDGLGSISQEILNEIANLGDDLSGLQGLSDKIDELIAVVKNFAAKFDKYSKDVLDAHSQEIALLKGLENSIDDIGTKTQTLINQAKKAEIQRQNIEDAINAIKAQVTNIEAKIGRTITPEELDSILAKHDIVIGDFISQIDVKPADLSTVEALIKAMKDGLVVYQGQATQLYIDILNAVKALGKTAPDYNQKLDEIKEILKNFKFECKCKEDCDHNDQIVHEGEIQIIQ